jgi:hypothetical protein
VSVPARLFSDPRNTYVVDNNDPGAFDKSHAGTPGTHSEQRCCRDRAPYWDQYRVESGEAKGQVAFQTSDPWALRNGRLYPLRKSLGLEGTFQKGDVLIEGPGSGYRPPWVTSDDEWYTDWQGLRKDPSVYGRWFMSDAPTKMRGGMPRIEFLWCAKCETGLENAWSSILDALPAAARGLAMIASYIPVFGTAVSFIVTTAVNLAEGQRIDAAALDAVGAALPGQPVSGMAFNATRAIVQGDRIDKVAIDVLVKSLPIDEGTKKYVAQTVTTASAIVVDVARGRPISDVALEEIYKQLPPEGKRSMDIARRLAAGENAIDIAKDSVLTQSTQAMQAAVDAAKASGKDAVNKFIGEAAYEGIMATLDPDLQRALKVAFVAGEIERRKSIPIGTFTTAEQNVPTNDAYAANGQKIIKSGTTWRHITLFEIRQRPSFTITIQKFDPLSGKTQPREETYEIDDQWRRGFDVAIGLCEGKKTSDLFQQKVRASLVNVHAQQGFDAGQAIQFERTASRAETLSASKSSLSMMLKPGAPSVQSSQPVVQALPPVGEPVPVSSSRTIDPALRVALANRGIALANKDPEIRAERAAQPTTAIQRGFDIATALLENRTAPSDVARVRVTLDAETMAGFDTGSAWFAHRHAERAVAAPAPASAAPTFFAPGQTLFVNQAVQASQMSAVQVARLLEDRAKWVSYYQQRRGMEER